MLAGHPQVAHALNQGRDRQQRQGENAVLQVDRLQEVHRRMAFTVRGVSRPQAAVAGPPGRHYSDMRTIPVFVLFGCV
jgi:hypothetical protein